MNIHSYSFNGFRACVFSTALAAACVVQAQSVEPDSDWESVLDEARGQTVYFNAWGGAQLVFIVDSTTTGTPPQSAAELLAFVEAGGRFSYSAPPW